LQVLGSWFLVLGSWFLVLGSWFLVLGSWFYEAPSPCDFTCDSAIQRSTRHQALAIQPPIQSAIQPSTKHHALCPVWQLRSLEKQFADLIQGIRSMIFKERSITFQDFTMGEPARNWNASAKKNCERSATPLQMHSEWVRSGYCA